MKTLQQCKEQAAEEIWGTEFQFIHSAYANNDETRANLLYKATDRAAEIYSEQFKPKWIDVNERIPEVGERYMSFSQIGNSRNIYAIHDMTIHMGIWSFEYAKVKYWMPLPEPPIL